MFVLVSCLVTVLIARAVFNTDTLQLSATFLCTSQNMQNMRLVSALNMEELFLCSTGGETQSIAVAFWL